MYNDPNTNFVIAMYRPFEGKQEEAYAVIKNHFPTLKEAGLVTEQQVLLLQSADGTYLEIFEWKSPEAAQEAHTHPVVGEFWGKMAELMDFTTLASLPEANKPFAPFRRA
ncbi:MAG: hypothetical protein ACXVP2_11800 [Tumebacillaceae bacterium]